MSSATAIESGGFQGPAIFTPRSVVPSTTRASSLHLRAGPPGGGLAHLCVSGRSVVLAGRHRWAPSDQPNVPLYHPSGTSGLGRMVFGRGLPGDRVTSAPPSGLNGVGPHCSQQAARWIVYIQSAAPVAFGRDPRRSARRSPSTLRSHVPPSRSPVAATAGSGPFRRRECVRGCPGSAYAGHATTPLTLSGTWTIIPRRVLGMTGSGGELHTSPN